MEAFILDHISERKSFAFETTLRDVTFEQAQRAKQRGFHVELIFVACGTEDEHIERVAERGVRGGHIASESTLRNTYRRSISMLLRAIEECERKTIDNLEVYHNPRTDPGTPPRPECILGIVDGRAVRKASNPPRWFEAALRCAKFADWLWT